MKLINDLQWYLSKVSPSVAHKKGIRLLRSCMFEITRMYEICSCAYELGLNPTKEQLERINSLSNNFFESVNYVDKKLEANSNSKEMA